MGKITHQAKKIAIVGPESTGKSTLAKQLANYFTNAEYTEEFARLHLERNGGKYDVTDLDSFATQQLLLEEKANSYSFLFCDTTPLSVKVWSLYRYGTASSKIDSLIEKSTYDLHLLLKPDIVYKEDPLREDAPLKNRKELFSLFEKELIKINADYYVVGGNGKLRLKNAIKVIHDKFSL